jgi:Zn-dependent protease
VGFDVKGFIVWFVAFLFSSTCHEAAHAWVALRGGDRTAYEGGQVTLDPLPHIRREPFGMLFAPILSFVFWGWMMGWASAPYDPRWGERHPRRHALMSLAGPCANLLLAVLSFAAIKALLAAGIFVIPDRIQNLQGIVVPAAELAHHQVLAGLSALLSVMLCLNLLLGLFNLMPVPPLDGASVLQGLFPDSLGRFYRMLRDTPMAQLAGLLVAWNLFPHLSGPALGLLLKLVVSSSGF